MINIQDLQDIQCPPFGIVIKDYGDSIEVRVSMFVKDLETKESNALSMRVYLPKLMKKKEAFKIVLELIEELACHEIREQFSINGDRLFNPHVDASLDGGFDE